MKGKRGLKIRTVGFVPALLLATALLSACSTSRLAGDRDTPAFTEPEMLLIPGADFRMGEPGYADSSPAHMVRVSSFYLDKCEITNAQYFAFCAATGHRPPEFWGLDIYNCGPEFPAHPVIGVSWLDARAYARWRGVRLPSEAEWECAARGGLLDRKYSHGDTLDPALYAPGGFTGSGGSSPVGSFPPNGFGLHDMTRNVAEWVQDWYAHDFYDISPRENPSGPGHGSFKVIRGGGWHTGPGCCRVYDRNALRHNWVDFNVGFRCARSAGQSVAQKLESLLTESGLEAALLAYEGLRASEPGSYYHDERELNDLGYRLLADGKVTEAIMVFKLSVEAFPLSYNALDSLAETHLARGEPELASQYYRLSLELNPRSRTGHEALQKLGVK